MRRPPPVAHIAEFRALAAEWRALRPCCTLCVGCISDALLVAAARQGEYVTYRTLTRAREGRRSCDCRSRGDALCEPCRTALIGVARDLSQGVEMARALFYLRSCGGGRADCYCAPAVDHVTPSGRALTGDRPP